MVRAGAENRKGVRRPIRGMPERDLEDDVVAFLPGEQVLARVAVPPGKSA